MKEMILSKRMQMVADMVPEYVETVADVGCDHAYISIYLVKKQGVKFAIAMDIKEGPLKIAKKNVGIYHAGNNIEFRLSDGLEKLKGNEVQVIMISGMGGILINEILEKGKKKLFVAPERKFPILILQPQSEITDVRKYLHAKGYTICKEKMTYEGGKFYTVMQAQFLEKQEAIYTELEYIYGKGNLKNRQKEFCLFLEKEKENFLTIEKKLVCQKNQEIIQKGSCSKRLEKRIAELKREIAMNREAFHYDYM